MKPYIIVGPDALDLARLANLQLHRAPARKGDIADVSPVVADQEIAAGCDPFQFYLELTALTPEESAHTIDCLIGLYRATHDALTGALP